MNYLTKHSALAIAAVLLTGCNSVPPVEEMEQVSGSELRQMVVGNTLSANFSWGKWVETFDADLNGNVMAKGSGWKETAVSSSTLSDDGEMCSQYTGDNEWAKPEFKYCNTTFRDTEGNLYFKVTENTRKPERVGVIQASTIEIGDPYGLNN